jgi:hypothetical protein
VIDVTQSETSPRTFGARTMSAQGSHLFVGNQDIWCITIFTAV